MSDPRHVIISSLVLITACAMTEPEDIESSQHAIRSRQGNYLLGATIDPLIPAQSSHLSLHVPTLLSNKNAQLGPNAPPDANIIDIHAVDGQLTVTANDSTASKAGTIVKWSGQDSELAGLELITPDHTLTVTQIGAMAHPHPSLSGRLLYLYYVRRDGPKKGVDLCGGDRAALAVPGMWMRDGSYVADPDRVSFACLDGVVAKCIQWGYAPWLGPSTWDHVVACTRMARADYCGTGASYTFEGTDIGFADWQHDAPLVNDVEASDFQLATTATAAQTAHPSTSFLEAGYNVDGAVCLSRLRWQNLPPGGPCPGKLPDPRLPPPSEDYDTLYGFCEDVGPTAHAIMAALHHHHDALLFNGSGENDRGLVRWTGWSGDSFTTTLGSTNLGGVAQLDPPDPALPTAHCQGTVLTELGRDVFQGLGGGTAQDTRELRSWYNGQRYVTTTQPPPQMTPVVPEGYIFAPDANHPRPPAAACARIAGNSATELVPLYRNSCNGEYHSTSTTPGSGSCYACLEGWILGHSINPVRCSDNPPPGSLPAAPVCP